MSGSAQAVAAANPEPVPFGGEGHRSTRQGDLVPLPARSGIEPDQMGAKHRRQPDRVLECKERARPPSLGLGDFTTDRLDMIEVAIVVQDPESLTGHRKIASPGPDSGYTPGAHIRLHLP